MSKEFKRHTSYKLKRVSPSWRKPKGLHNKVRKELSGYYKKVKIGYKRQNSGAKHIIVSCLDELKKISDKSTNILISSTIGQRKKVQIIKSAKDLGLKIVNIKDDYLENVEKDLKERKSLKETRKKKKEDKKKELDKKAKEKEKEKEKEQALESKLTDQEKKEKEKKEKDALLTRKDVI